MHLVVLVSAARRAERVLVEYTVGAPRSRPLLAAAQMDHQLPQVKSMRPEFVRLRALLHLFRDVHGVRRRHAQEALQLFALEPHPVAAQLKTDSPSSKYIGVSHSLRFNCSSRAQQSGRNLVAATKQVTLPWSM